MFEQFKDIKKINTQAKKAIFLFPSQFYWGEICNDMNTHTSTNYFDINQKKYVKIDLFVMSLNNGLGLGFKTQTPPLILNIPPHIKHGASY